MSDPQVKSIIERILRLHAESETIVGLYLAAYDGPSRTHVHVPAREAAYPERVSRPASMDPAVGDSFEIEAGRGENARKATPATGDTASVNHAQAGERPAPFNLSLDKPLRPHCQNRDACGSYGSKHCGPCLRAAGLTEAA